MSRCKLILADGAVDLEKRINQYLRGCNERVISLSVVQDKGTICSEFKAFLLLEDKE